MKDQPPVQSTHTHKKCKCDKDCKRCKALKEIHFEPINQH